MFKELPKEIQERVTYLMQADNFSEAAELRDTYLYLNSVVETEDDYETIDSLDHPAFIQQYSAQDSLNMLH